MHNISHYLVLPIKFHFLPVYSPSPIFSRCPISNSQGTYLSCGNNTVVRNASNGKSAVIILSIYYQIILGT